MTGKTRGKLGFIAMNTETARLIVHYRGNFGGPGAKICFWDGNGNPVNKGPLMDLIERVERYKLIAGLDNQTPTEFPVNKDDMNLSSNWENGTLSDYTEEYHDHEIHNDPSVELPLGGDRGHLTAAPVVSHVEPAVLEPVVLGQVEQDDQSEMANAVALEHPVQNSEANANEFESYMGSNVSLSDIFGPSLGDTSTDKSIDFGAYLDSPAPAYVNQNVEKEDFLPDYVSDVEENPNDITLTETSMDDVSAVGVISNPICEDEMSIDNSDTLRVEKDQMEISTGSGTPI